MNEKKKRSLLLIRPLTQIYYFELDGELENIKLESNTLVDT